MLAMRRWLRKHSTVVGVVVAVGLYLMALVPHPWWFLGIVLIAATWFVHKILQVTNRRLKEALEAVEQRASGGSSYMHYDVETGQWVCIF